MPAFPVRSSYAAAADELHRQEIARLKDFVAPSLKSLRGMTPADIRAVIGVMLQSFGHKLITDPSMSELLVTGRNDQKFLIACATPTNPAPTKLTALCEFHSRIIAANTVKGFYITPRRFAREAEQFAASAGMKLFDGPRLIVSLQRSKADLVLPDTDKAMCRLCGDIVHHRIDQPRARPCANSHPIAPTIPRAMIEAPGSTGAARKPNQPLAQPQIPPEFAAEDDTISAAPATIRSPRLR